MHPKLYKAATSGDVGLLERVASEDMQLLLSKAPQQNTALHIAARFGHADFARSILLLCSQLLRMKNSDEDTALHCATRAGRCLEIVQILVDFDPLTRTAAHDDLEEGGSSSVELLRIQNKEGDTALHEAVRKQREDMAIKMLRADPKLPFIVNNAKESSFLLAVKGEMEGVVKEILLADGSTNSGEQNSAAIGNNSELTVEEKKELIKIQDNVGKTALHYAAWRNNAKIVGMILRSDSSNVPYITDENGHSPLHVAAAFGMQDSMSKLLEQCPDAIEQLDKDSRNVLHIAVLNQRFGIIDWLEKLPSIEGFLNEHDKDGNTAIHLSSKEEFPNSFFWHKRADITVRNKDGLTPIDLNFYSWLLPRGFRRGPAWGRPQNIPHVIPVKEPGLGSKESSKVWALNNQYRVVVASLIATSTFTAAFTLPGGYRSSDELNPGTAILSNKSNFKIFLLLDTLAMCLSIVAIFSYIVGGTKVEARFAERRPPLVWLSVGNALTFAACICMLFAFASGVSLVLPPNNMDVAERVYAICSLLPGFVVLSIPSVLFVVVGTTIMFFKKIRKASAAHAWNKCEAHRLPAV